MAVTRFESSVVAQTVGTADVEKLAQSFERLSGSIDKAATQSRKVSEHPGFDDFAEKLRRGIQNPMQGAGVAVESLLKGLGPVGVAVGVAGTAIVGFGALSIQAARELGNLGDAIEDTASRMGLTTREAQEFSLAMKFAGGDIAGLEGIMRKLSTEIDGGGKNLRKIGVEIYDVGTGAIRPTSELVLQLAERLNALPAGAQRNAAAIQVMGRGALEVLPDLLALNEALEKARATGTFFSDKDLKQFDEVRQRLVEIEARWDFMVAKLKQGLLIPFEFVFGGGKKKAPEGKFGSANFPLSFTDSPFAGMDPGIQAQLEAELEQGRKPPAPTAEQAAAVARNEARIAAALGPATDLERLAQAKQKLEELFRTLKHGVTEEVNQAAFDQIAAQRGLITAIAARIERTKELEDAERSLVQFERQMGERDLDPIDRILADRDRLLASGADPGRTSGAAELGIAGIVAGLQEDINAFVFGGRTERGDLFGIFDDLARRLDEFNRTQEADRQVSDLGRAVDRERQMILTERQVRLAELAAGPGQEVGLAGLRFDWRTQLAERLRSSGVAAAEKLTDEQEKRVALAAEEAEFSHRMYEAKIAFELEIAELQRRRIDALRNEAGALFDSLLRGPEGLRQFASSLLLGEARKVVQNIAVEVFGGASAHLGLPGKIFQGTLLGVDPLKDQAALKLSTAGTELSVAAHELMAAARVQATSASGGEGAFFSRGASAGGGIYFPGFGGGEADLYNLPARLAHQDVSLSPAPGADLLRPGFNWPRAIGYAGAAAAAGFGIYSGIQQGGGRGATVAIASALGGAAIIPGPQQPFLAGAALMAGLFSQFFPDPKAARDAEMEQRLAAARYEGPAAGRYAFDRFGRGIDYDIAGNVRPIEVNIHIDAMDARSVIDQRESIAAAVVTTIEEQTSPRLASAIRRVARG